MYYLKIPALPSFINQFSRFLALLLGLSLGWALNLTRVFCLDVELSDEAELEELEDDDDDDDDDGALRLRLDFFFFCFRLRPFSTDESDDK